MTILSRRGFLAAGVAVAAVAQFSRAGAAKIPALSLKAETRVLDIRGRAATDLGLTGPTGQGLVLDPGQRFRVDLTNALDEPTLIHWHGQIPPNEQDGVPDLPMRMLRLGESRAYDFAPQAGTHWMHAHIPMQEMRLLAAPLIVRRPQDASADRQEVVMFLQDFAFNAPEEVMAEIAGGHGGMDHSAHGAPDVPLMHQNPAGHGEMPKMAMDLNDHDWDAYLANDRTLDDPDVVQVERGGRVLLRIINAASATVFWIDSGAVPARLVAVDGHPVRATSGHRFGISMGQRLDLELDLPSQAGAWPILALREGARERTGLVLAAKGAVIPRVPVLSSTAAPAFDIDLAQETRLVGLEPLAERAVDRGVTLMLGGSMRPYRWTIDERIWGEHVPVETRTGERVEITFHNMSMMAHPMHLHGHVFQVVAVNGSRIRGARRDTVHVPPMAKVTVALDAGEAARWMLHCHHMPHLQTGMMTEFAIS
ncbi:multicopper oxidase family protein [Paracoccus aestuariivivens]|uniref:Multicopper oxidase domain-containing protein n=1 Tax=Paracoccus aestuariivivens TaxID=1820333 RepID=A0A6L6JAC6_9RHOB|nr:multicopper oxidase family protein [Paracoccus aestuariivivens]MTH78068.1 multicopper oxidase domain-containing protein [Paracoccus aestuariivivens]